MIVYVKGVQTLAIRIFLRIRRPFLRVIYWQRGLNRPSVNWVLLVGPPVLLVKKKFGHPCMYNIITQANTVQHAMLACSVYYDCTLLLFSDFCCPTRRK